MRRKRSPACVHRTPDAQITAVFLATVLAALAALICGCASDPCNGVPEATLPHGTSEHPLAFVPLWTVDTNDHWWWGVDSDPASGHVYAMRYPRLERPSEDRETWCYTVEVCRINARGEIVQTIKATGIKDQPYGLRVARDGERVAFLTPNTGWQEGACIFNDQGRILWESELQFTTSAVVDLDRDGHDEVLIGTTTGQMHAIGLDGRVVWTKPWHWPWFAAPVEEGGAEERFVSGDANPSKRIVFAQAAGEAVRSIDPKMLVLKFVEVRGAGAVRFVAIGSNPLLMVAYDADLQEVWRRADRETDACGIVDAVASSSCPWIAVLVHQRGIRLYNAENGDRLAIVPKAYNHENIAWLERGEGHSPLLVHATGHGLTAYELQASPSVSQ